MGRDVTVRSRMTSTTVSCTRIGCARRARIFAGIGVVRVRHRTALQTRGSVTGSSRADDLAAHESAVAVLVHLARLVLTLFAGAKRSAARQRQSHDPTHSHAFQAKPPRATARAGHDAGGSIRASRYAAKGSGAKPPSAVRERFGPRIAHDQTRAGATLPACSASSPSTSSLHSKVIACARSTSQGATGAA